MSMTPPVLFPTHKDSLSVARDIEQTIAGNVAEILEA